MCKIILLLTCALNLATMCGWLIKNIIVASGMKGPQHQWWSKINSFLNDMHPYDKILTILDILA